MARGKATPPKLVGQFLAEFLSGLSESEAAAKVGLPQTTASDVLKALGPEFGKVRSDERGSELAELVSGSLRSKFAALGNIETQLSDAAWRKAQSAESLACLYEHISGATERILSALEPNGGGEPKE